MPVTPTETLEPPARQLMRASIQNAPLCPEAMAMFGEATAKGQLGGWKTLEMVLRYAHLMPKQKEEAILLMQRTGTHA